MTTILRIDLQVEQSRHRMTLGAPLLFRALALDDRNRSERMFDARERGGLIAFDRLAERRFLRPFGSRGGTR
jgi:hypothetical protein